MNRQPFLLPALLLLTALRLAALPLRELSPLEAYATVCGEHDGMWHAMLGPVLPTLVHVTTAIFGDNEFGVRVLAPLLMLGSSWMLWHVARGLFDAQTAAWGIVFFNALPAVNLAAVTFTPMTLGIVLSTGLLLALRRALHHAHRWHLEWWTVSAVLCVSFFTDWRLIFFALAAAFALAVTGRGRRALLKWPVLPIAGGALCVSVTVFLAWASEHRWIALRTFADSPPIPFVSIIWRTLLAHPVPVIAAISWALVECVRRKPLTYPVAYLFAFAMPMITLDVLAFRAHPWPQCGYAGWSGPLVLLVAFQVRQWQPVPLAMKPLVRFLVLALAGLQSCILFQTDVLRRSGVAWKFSAGDESAISILPVDPSRDLVGWREFADALRTILKDEEAKLQVSPLIVADRWQLAAPLGFYLKDAPVWHPGPSYPVVMLLPKKAGLTPYDFRPGLTEALMKQAPVLYITDHADAKSPPSTLTKQYSKIRLVGYFNISHDNLTVRSVKVFACSE